MARSMYSLLTRTPFWIPTDPGPLAIYYPPPVEIVEQFMKKTSVTSAMRREEVDICERFFFVMRIVWIAHEKCEGSCVKILQISM